jgi:hypothetical protein
MESPMMQTVQLSLTDGAYEAMVREALARSCAWRLESAHPPDLSHQAVLVLDEAAFERLPLPVANPERVVLITRKDPQILAEAWEAGIVSVVSDRDPLSTVLLAIMAAALRVAKSSSLSGISPNTNAESAPLPPQNRISGSKRSKIQ